MAAHTLYSTRLGNRSGSEFRPLKTAAGRSRNLLGGVISSKKYQTIETDVSASSLFNRPGTSKKTPQPVGLQEVTKGQQDQS